MDVCILKCSSEMVIGDMWYGRELHAQRRIHRLVKSRPHRLLHVRVCTCHAPVTSLVTYAKLLQPHAYRLVDGREWQFDTLELEGVAAL